MEVGRNSVKGEKVRNSCHGKREREPVEGTLGLAEF